MRHPMEDRRTRCRPLPGAPPWGSAQAPLSDGRQSNQAANTTRVATLENTAIAPAGLTPWNFWRGRVYEQNSTRSAEAVTACGGPVTFVAQVNSRSTSSPPNTTPTPIEIPTLRSTIQSDGGPFCRLQAVVEWSTGTGTNQYAVLDIDQGFVFRVFGTMCRIHFLYFPGGDRAIGIQSRQITTNDPIVLPAGNGEQLTLDCLQASIQTSKNRAEGFPGSWQCTALLEQGPYQACFIPPLARNVQITQQSTGTAVPYYEWRDREGRIVGVVDTPTRTSRPARVPLNAVRLSIPPGPVPVSSASAVFDVSQF